MDKLLCHTGRSFTLNGLEDHAEALRRSMPKQLEAQSVSEISLSPVVDPYELEYLAGLSQFYPIPNKVLFKLVRAATGHKVSDRWVAIRLIVAMSLPIPVPKPPKDAQQG